jgi:hypothetical protein
MKSIGRDENEKMKFISAINDLPATKFHNRNHLPGENPNSAS